MKIFITANNYFSFKKHRRGLANYLKNQKNENHEVHVILPESDKHEITDLSEFHFHFIPLSRRGIHPLAEIRTILAFCQLYFQYRPDVVHHFTIKPVIYGTFAAMLTNVKRIVNSITGLGYVYIGETLTQKVFQILADIMYRMVLSSGAQVIFQNPDDMELFKKRSLVKDENAHLVLGSGVNLDKFKPVEGISLDRPLKFYFISRMIWSKGVQELVNAAQVLKASHLSFELHFLGESDPGNPNSVSDQMLRQWHNEKIIIHHGYQDNVVAMLQAADIVILPSWYREGVPMSLLEAMACKKPIITTDMPGCRDLIQNNGLLVKPRDSNALARAMEYCIQNPSKLSYWGENSLRIVKATYSSTAIHAKIYSIYKAEND